MIKYPRLKIQESDSRYKIQDPEFMIEKLKIHDFS